MFEDRQYQLDAVDYAMNASGRPILCSPTGSGKSYICALMAQRTIKAGGTFGILTPREEILNQMVDTMREVCGEFNVGVIKAGHDESPYAPVQVISWPTLVARVGRYGEGYLKPYSRLAIDECHLAVSPRMVERILPYYEGCAEVVGVTATPARKNGRGLGHFFSEIKHVTTVRQLIKDEKLAPLEYWAGRLPDVEGVRTTGGDFNSKDLRERTAPLVGDVIDNWSRLARERHTLVFAVDVAHCEALAERFQMAGVTAAPLHVHMMPEKRQRIVEAFKRREIQVLVNVTIASYGFDAPTVDCVVLARPTKSIVLHLQMLGRGMRIADGKEACMVLDHADNVRRLGQADDLYRWRLSKGRAAAGNWTRHEANPDKESDEESLRECEECHHMFARSRVCPKCGWEIPIVKRDIAATDAALVRIGEQQQDVEERGWPDNQTFYRMLIGYALHKNYSLKWAYFRYLDRTGEKPKWGWDRLAPLNPNVRVRNWIIKGLRHYHAKQKAKRAAH
jgi:superfamily II DNA or RNA helicase